MMDPRPRGRPRRVATQSYVEARQRHEAGETWASIGRALGVAPETLRRHSRGLRLAGKGGQNAGKSPFRPSETIL